MGIPYFHIDMFKRVFGMFREACDKAGYTAKPEQMGWGVPIYVAETDKQARAEFEPACWYFVRNLLKNAEYDDTFVLLTANSKTLARPELARIAERHGRTVNQIVFRFALDVGIVPLTGTTDVGHMRADVEVLDFGLDPEEVARIERLES